MNIMDQDNYDDWALEVGIEATCKAYDYGWDSLSEMEKCFCVVNDIEREVYNGGFDQFFHNSSGDLAIFAVEYLVKLGAMKTAKITKEAMSFFPNSSPSQDQEIRWQQMKEIESKHPMAWESLDDEFYDLEEDRHLKMLELHRTNHLTSQASGTPQSGAPS